MTILLVAMGLVVGLAVGWWWGRRGARETYGGPLLELSRRLRGAEVPWDEQGGAPGAVDAAPEIRHLQDSLRLAWVPRESARQEAVDEALDRIGGYLRNKVELPLLEGVERDDASLRQRANQALDALDDLGFFLSTEVPHTLDRANLVTLIQEVSREWTHQFDSPLTFSSNEPVVHSRVAPDAFKDAFYLILANAGRFGAGKAVEVEVDGAGEAVRIRVADGGPGFSADALERGLEPLFTTESDALGLGLSHARRVVRALGGEIRLRNRDGGGGEVEITLPNG